MREEMWLVEGGHGAVQTVTGAKVVLLMDSDSSSKMDDRSSFVPAPAIVVQEGSCVALARSGVGSPGCACPAGAGSLVASLPLPGKERLAMRRRGGVHVGQPVLHSRPVHLHGQVVEGGGDEALFHLADGASFLRLVLHALDHPLFLGQLGLEGIGCRRRRHVSWR